MVKIYKLIILVTVLFPLSLQAQVNTMGPFDTYVSVQQPAKKVVYSGSRSGWADEGRMVRVNIQNVQGPITVAPMQFNLDGPACPTYDEHGRRTPAAPAPRAEKDFSGSVSIKDIPAAGTSVNASFEGKDDGYWTTCSSGQKHLFSEVVHVDLKIHSLKLLMEKHDVAVCKGASTHVNITTKFPESGGTVTYQSVNGKVNVSDNGNGCMMTFIENGSDLVVATLTAGEATYKDTIKVKAVEVEFAKATYNYLCPADEVVNATTLLTATSARANLEWKYIYNGGAETVWNPATFDKKNFRAGDILIVKVESKDAPACKATATLRFYSLDLVIANRVICDGRELPFSVTVRPFNAAAAAELMPTVAGLAGKYSLSTPSFGNPKGNTTLTFAAFGPTYNSKVENMIWYATAADLCNDQSSYKLWVEGTVNAKKIESFWYTVTADVNGGNCCNGSAYPLQTFTGLPRIITIKDNAGKWYGWIDAIGTFARNVKCTTTNICAPNSQYRAMIQAEEDYHVGQMEMTNGSRASADQWVVDNVLSGAVMLRKWYSISGDQAQSRALAWHVFITRRNAENARSWAQFAYPSATRCFMENEAKVRTGASHRFRFKCAYPACP